MEEEEEEEEEEVIPSVSRGIAADRRQEGVDQVQELVDEQKIWTSNALLKRERA